MNTKFSLPKLLWVLFFLVVIPSPPAICQEGPQRAFSTGEEAVQSLFKAVKENDKGALFSIFGPDASDLINSGDDVADKNAIERFSRRMAEETRLARPDSSHAILYVGKEEWPFPIPLVKKNGKWRFDTPVGREEILNRRIGKNEIEAIAVCRDYVASQLDYAAEKKGKQYALRLITTPGKSDGLYEESTEDESALGKRVEKAKAEGYGPTAFREGGIVGPYHGYYYKILTAQGANAPGGEKDYLVKGKLVRGFGLLSYPAQWKNSGVMTFMVNQEGQIFQKNLGDHTEQIARDMKEYNPDKSWIPLPPETPETQTSSAFSPERQPK